MLVMHAPVVSVPHINPVFRPAQQVLAHIELSQGAKSIAIPALVLVPGNVFTSVRIHFHTEEMTQELAVKHEYLTAR